MNSSDLIAHLEGIGKDARDVEGVFKTLSAAEKFTLRLDAFRKLAKDAGKTEFSLAEIAENLFPGLKPESFRTASADFRATVSKVTEATNRDFRIVQPDLRKRSLDERKWICEGGFADEALVALSRKGIEKRELAGELTELFAREDEDPEIAALREKEEPAELDQVEAMARFTHHEIRDLIGEEDEYEELRANPERLATLGESKGMESKSLEPEGIPLLPELRDWALDPNSCAYLALLGETGCGKTMTAMELAGKLLDDPAAPIAIYFDLRLVNQDGLLKRNRRPLLADILEAMLNRSGMDNPPSAEAVIDAVRKRKALLIWDGLDEVLVGLTADEGEAFFAQLQAILPVAECHREGAGRLMFGCRTQFFRNVAQEKSVFTGSQRERFDPVSAESDEDEMVAQRADFKILRVLPFTESQIRSYLESNVAGLDVDRALEVINTVHNLRELAKRPYLLSLMRRVLPNLDSALADGRPVRSIDLYAGFIDQWIARDTGKHQLLPHDKLRIMALLATRMWKDSLRVLPVSELEQWLFETLLNEPVWKSTYGSKIESDERDLLLEDFRTATFLGRWDGDEFRFAHTSLQEYFLARALFDSLDAGDPGTWSLPMPSPETFGFLAEMWTQVSEANPESVGSRLEANLSELLRSPEANAAKQPAFAFYLALHRGPHASSAPAIDSIDLRGGLDFTAWEIRGESGRRLPLRRAIFSGSKWLRAVFESVDLSESVFADCDLRSAEFLDCDLSGADFGNIGPSRMEGVLTRHCRLSGATAPSATIPGLRLLGNRWENDPSGEREWRNCTDLRHAAPLVDEIHVNAEEGSSNLKLEPATGHSHWVNACAPIGDGARFLSASSDHSLILWDTQSGEILRRFEGHSSRVSGCAPIGDGARFLSASRDHSLILWDTESGEITRRFEGHSDRVNACAPIDNGARFLSASRDNSLILWGAESGELLRRFEGHRARVNACAPIGDGTRFLSASRDNSLIFWNIESGELLRRFEGHRASVNACAPIGDGARFLSASTDNSLILWDTESGELLRRFEGHRASVNACAPIGDGSRFLSASNDNSLILWDTDSGELLHRFEGHGASVNGCAPIGDGTRFLSASNDNSLILWDIESGELLRRFEGRGASVNACAPIGDGARFLSASNDNSLILWNIESGELLRRFEGHGAWVNGCAPIGDGARFLSASNDNSLILWDLESGELLRRFGSHGASVNGCAPIGDGARFLSASNDNSLILWDTESGELLRRFEGHSVSVNACAPIGDGSRFLSASSDNSLILWDTDSGKLLRRFGGHHAWVRACALIGDGACFLSASLDYSLILWDTESGELLRRFEGHRASVNACALIGDGARFLSASSDNSLILWDTESGELLRRFEGHRASVLACAPIGDGARFLSASSDNSLILWDTESGEILHRYFHLPGHEAASRRGDENRLASATPGAWRYFNYLDPEKGIAYPAEIFGPLPTGSGN